MCHRGLIIILLAFFTGAYRCNALNNNTIQAEDSSSLIHLYEDTLNELQYQKANLHTSDAYRQDANQRFLSVLKRALMLPGSFNYPFDSLKTLSRLTSPDKQFRILNWNVAWHNGTSGYYGFIQSYDARKKAYTLYELKDKSTDIANQQSAVGTTDNWLGMLYYKIIPDENEKNTYILLAWEGYSDIITRKVIDVISFNSEGVPSFGKAIFKKLPTGTKNVPKRIIFQYSANLTMSLQYNEAKKMILFDHLCPIDPSLSGQYQYYGPSFQVDALVYSNNEWEYMENVEARNRANSNDKNYHPESEDYKENKKPIYISH